MAPHSSVLAWRIPGMAEPGGLPSVGSHRVGHKWSDLAAAAAVYISEKAMAPHSCTLAWKIPWMEEPGRLQSMGSRRVRHYWTTSLFSLYALEKEMGTHSSVLAWRIPGMGEPGGLPSLGSHRVGRDWSDLAAAVAAAAAAVYIYQPNSPNWSHSPLLPRGHMPLLYVCLSIPALQTGSSVHLSSFICIC